MDHAEPGPDYGSLLDPEFVVRYRARCRCGVVRYEVCADPVDAKICHCSDCQIQHGAPMQWAAIFYKKQVRFTAGFEQLTFYNVGLGVTERRLPCKLRCQHCGTLVADEGRKMWLAFPTLFDFGSPPHVPAPFRPSCHIFYANQVMDVHDDLPKWSGHKNKSTLMTLP